MLFIRRIVVGGNFSLAYPRTLKKINAGDSGAGSGPLGQGSEMAAVKAR